jgi:hypothetical protein
VRLERNFPKKFIEDLHTRENQGISKYLEVYPGAIGDIPDAYYSSENPIIHYEQKQEQACAFYSIASVLHYLGYIDVATLILNSRHDFIQEKSFDGLSTLKYCEKGEMTTKRKRYHKKWAEKLCLAVRIYRWDHFIDRYMCHTRCQHKYISMAIDSNFNILKAIVVLKEDEFIVSSLESVDGEVNHVVCFTRRYIFDSNAPRALTFSKEALDAICIDGFRNLHKGYYYHHRSKREIILDIEAININI